MSRKTLLNRIAIAAAIVVGAFAVNYQREVRAAGPELIDRNLELRTVATGLGTPTAFAFIGPNDVLVLEKQTGRVIRIFGNSHATVLDLAVNNGSERGLLGIALDPDFATNRQLFLYWTESLTGSDTGVLSETPLLGNRVDRFTWDGANLTMDANIIRLRAIQQDAGQPERGNHDGGVLRVGPDNKLYVFVGDLGRRGNLQNLRCGPANFYNCPPTAPMPDDQFGGPAPDDEHMSGVVLRLNLDGTAPADNPFFAAGAAMGGEAGANIQKIFSYGHRNSFGMAFDPESGGLWLQENGDDSFSELNRVTAGMNGGWVQFMGPASRIAEFKAIETTFGAQNLQQLRWPPANIAGSTAEAMSRLFQLPGSHYEDPAFSWKWEVAPGGIGFISGRALGPQYDGDLIVGAGTPLLAGGYLFRFNLTGNRRQVGVDDPRLADRVADNVAKHEITESESLLFGHDFGVTTDVRTGPNGNLFVLSLTNGALYEIARRK
jgi:glucose/arabinose dehydrogenase